MRGRGGHKIARQETPVVSVTALNADGLTYEDVGPVTRLSTLNTDSLCYEGPGPVARVTAVVLDEFCYELSLIHI